MSRAIFKMRGHSLNPIEIVGEVLGNESGDNPGGIITHDLGNIDVGPAGSKTALMAISWDSPGGDPIRSITSLTIGGVSLSEVAGSAINSNVLNALIYTGNLSSLSGSQAISVTFDGNTSSTAISGVSIVNLASPIPVSVDTDVTVAGDILILTNLATNAGGITIGLGASSDNDSLPSTWVNLTEKSAVLTGAGADPRDHVHSAAWNLGERSPLNATVDFDIGGVRIATGAGFR